MEDFSYKGWIEEELSDSTLANLYSKLVPKFLSEIKQNQYLLAKDKNGKIIDKFVKTQNCFEQVRWRAIDNGYCDIVKPRNI